MSYLDDTGLAYFWTKIKAYVSSFLTWTNIQNKPSTFAPSAHSHGNITNAGELGTASRAVVTDGNKKVSVSSVTSTELGYLSGVTSNVQTQLNGKADSSAIPSIPSLSRTISGSGNAITDITVSGHAITATKGSTFLTSHQTLPTLSLTTSGNGNAITALSVSNHAITATKGSTFLTSHQSLANYVTLNGAQTISGAKTFTGEIIGINKDNSTDNANSLYSTTVGSKLTYYTTTSGGTKLTNVPAAVNTTLESRTIRRLSNSDWIVEQICHNSNGLYYRIGNSGTWGAWRTFAFTDSNITGNAATVSGTAGTSLLAWNTENTVYTVGGHAIKVKLPANPNTDTHWTSHLYAGASNGKANAATTNGNTYLIICDDTTARDRRLIKGTGATTVTSDSSGNITINSTDNNTTYAAGTGLSLSGTTFNVSTVPIANGGTGATSRLNAVKALMNENVGTGAQYFLTIIGTWGKAGYTSVADAKTVLGLGSAAYTASTAYAAASHTHSYLPLSGGSMTGTITTSASTPLKLNNASVTTGAQPSSTLQTFYISINEKTGSNYLQQFGGMLNKNGSSYIRFYAKPNIANATGYILEWIATSSNCTLQPQTNNIALLGASNNRWEQIWCHQSSINSSSDARMKSGIAGIPDEVLDAWAGINWVQFQFNESIAEKGAEKARLHTGLIAQDVDAAFKELGLDVSRYGLFLYDSWDATAEELDEEGKVVTPGREAGDAFGLRYVEALCVEASYQRRENARLRARIASLEDRLAALELRLGSE